MLKRLINGHALCELKLKKVIDDPLIDSTHSPRHKIALDARSRVDRRIEEKSNIFFIVSNLLRSFYDPKLHYSRVGTSETTNEDSGEVITK